MAAPLALSRRQLLVLHLRPDVMRENYIYFHSSQAATAGDASSQLCSMTPFPIPDAVAEQQVQPEAQ